MERNQDQEYYERFMSLLDEIDVRHEACSRLEKEFDKLGFFGLMFKGGKNLRRRSKLLDETDQMWHDLSQVGLEWDRWRELNAL